MFFYKKEEYRGFVLSSDVGGNFWYVSFKRRADGLEQQFQGMINAVPYTSTCRDVAF